ncbi:DUF1772 domain-containing protein [Methylopila turkensis]|uniref:Membrane protein n=1 Tax=Methylopila turkensis TaxID=1437816 RepID=A0A9W6JMY3_9HYPH|nr:anthrone oxygenase family protein [Methylopila turkensis]GLK79203.1 membrane protein [Methylopila turkensis]
MSVTSGPDALLLAASVGAGLIGGLFFAFSNFVMPALDRLAARDAIAAMQAINVTVLNAGFFVVFFGTGALALAGAAWSLSPAAIAGAALYAAGTLGVTIACNVPLNERLKASAPDHGDAEARWAAYRGPWTRWNHVRTAASLAAALALALGAG